VDRNPLQLLIAKMRTRGPISDEAAQAILQLPAHVRSYDPPAYLLREGAIEPTICSFIISGYAFRQKLTADGARQIVSLHMRGDLLDVQHMFLNRTDHSVQALTRVEVLNIERSALRRLILDDPTIGKVMWIDALVEASIFREWVVNVGRRVAKARIAHLLCEFATRLRVAGLGDGRSCVLPMTQEQIGDAVGLTPVHVNRTLKALVEDGAIERNKREISFSDWERIRHLGDFTDLYLHLDQFEGVMQ
jgi:CRP-like cAMP-binding protein